MKQTNSNSTKVKNKSFEKWLVKQKEERNDLLKGVGLVIVLPAVIAFIIGWTIIGSILIILMVLVFWAGIDNWFPKEADFLAEQEEKKAEKAKENAERKRVAKQNERVAKQNETRLKKLESKFDTIEKNCKKLMSIDCPRPIEFKNNLSEHEKDLMSKGTPEYLHKFVKISTFLNDLWSHLVNARQDIRDEYDPKRLVASYQRKKRSERDMSLGKASMEELHIALERKAEGDFKDYSADGLVRTITNIMEESLKVFPKEFAQVTYLEAMANSMLIFLIEGKQIYFFEILETFDKLGALDSSWQKSVSNKMSSIESKLDLITSGISNLNENIDRLIEKNDDISKQLQSIDSGISTNNVLQAITSYQVYKINKQTKGLIK